jgi:phosphopantothenate synthetase
MESFHKIKPNQVLAFISCLLAIIEVNLFFQSKKNNALYNERLKLINQEILILEQDLLQDQDSTISEF